MACEPSARVVEGTMDDLVQRLQQSLPQRYQLERELGRGPHAVVYRALESHPRRQVAIKVLRPEVTERLGHEQFLARLDQLSNLTHPHIVPIYAAGDAGGLLYYVMPFVEGMTVRERLDAEGPLPLSVSLRVATDVAEALDYAHRRGVVHGDVKPENVVLHGDDALVTDFGVTQAIEQAGATGDAEGGDAHGDIHALAALMVEMMTGELPTDATWPAADRDRPARLPDLDALIRRALAPASAGQALSAGDLAEALATIRASRASAAVAAPAPGAHAWHRLAGGGWRTIAVSLTLAVAVLVGTWLVARPPADAPRVSAEGYVDSVAVMPAENHTGERWLDTVSEALTYEVVTSLQKIPELKTSAYMSVRAQGGDSIDPRAIGRALGVRLIMLPQFRRVGERVRLDAELVEAATGRVVLSDQWPVTTRNEPRLLSELRSGLVRLITLEAGIAQLTELAPRAGPAHHEYVLGKYWLGRRTPAGIRRAVSHFMEAIREDSTLAQAYEGLSTAYVLALFYRYQIGLDGYEIAGRALRAANRATELDPAFASAYAARGYVISRTYGPWREAARDFDRALELEPNSAQAVAWSASAMVEAGEVDRGIDATRRAIALDPLSPARQLSLAYAALPLGRYDLVLDAARRATELEPELAVAWALEGRTLLLQGRAEECLSIDFGPHGGVRALCLHALGRREEAQAVVDSIAAVVTQPGSIDMVYTDVVRVEDLATYYAWTGDRALALTWLEEAFRLSPIGVDRRVLQAALFDRLREDPAAARELDAIVEAVWARVQAHAARLP